MGYLYPFTDATLQMVEEISEAIGVSIELVGYELNFEARDKVITGSDLAAVCGASDYGKGMAQVIAQKLSGIPLPENGHMRRGKFMEPFILETWIQQNMLAVQSMLAGATSARMTMGEFRVSDDLSLGVTYDLLIYKDASPVYCVDFKCPKEIHGSLPTDYYYQSQAQARTAGLPDAEMFEYDAVGDTQSFCQRLEGPEWWAEVEQYLSIATAYLDAGTVPEDAVEPKRKRKALEATEEQQQAFLDLQKAVDAAEANAEEVEACRLILASTIEPGETVSWEGWSAGKSTRKVGGGTKWKELAIAKGATPQEILAYTTVGTDKEVFTVKGPK